MAKQFQKTEESEFHRNCEYWLVSVPAEKDTASTWDKLSSASRKLAEIHKFTVPDLRVGTLDQLLAASSDLERLEHYVMGVIVKLVETLLDVQEGDRDLVEENILVDGQSVHNYIGRFRWEMAKYPIRQSTKGIEGLVEKQIFQIETEMKNKHTTYIEARLNLTQLERNESGSLVTRNVSDLVKKEDFVLDSDHLTTALVVVSKPSYKDWYNSYERLDDEVIPRSTSLIAEDTDFGLFTVTLFKRHLDKFTKRAKERKFVVKDFSYNEAEIEMKRTRHQELRAEKSQLHGPLVRWLRINFSEAYIALTHVKAMRLFVESVLRFGLPADFVSCILFVPKKNTKRLREILYKDYAYLDGFLPFADLQEEDSDMVGFETTDYYPYVFFTIQAELRQFK